MIIENILTNIFGYAVLGIFTVGLYEYYVHRKSRQEALLQEAIFNSKKQKEVIKNEIKKIDEVILDKQQAYDKKKQELYELYGKRNNSSNNSDSSN